MPGRRAWMVVLCLCLSLSLAACTRGRGDPYTLSPLHIAGLHHLPALEQFIDENDGGNPGITVFRAADDVEPQVLLIVNDQLEVVGLDGGERQLDSQIKCGGVPTVTADGQWGACVGPQGTTQANTLEIFSLAPGPAQRHEFQLSGGDGYYFDPIWAPNGSRLALATRACTVQVFSVASTHSSLTPVVSFKSDALYDNVACKVAGLGWSSDSTHLEIAVAATQSESLRLDGHIAIPSTLPTAGDSITIPAGEFASFIVGSWFNTAAWNPQSGTIALAGSNPQGGGDKLLYYAPGALQVQTWFTLGDTTHFLGRMAWMPDGRQLLIVVLGPSCLDSCNGYALPDVYLYAPPSGA